MSLTEAEERDLKVAVMKADLDLKQKQGFWETPRNIAILVGAAAAFSGAVSGALGFKIGQSTPAAQTIILQLAPGTTIASPK
jgi:hypothetical protein